MGYEFGVLSKDKWRLYPSQLHCALEGKFYDVLPVNIHLSPSLVCNFRCSCCTYGSSKLDVAKKMKNGEAVPREKIKMPREYMKNILDKIKNAKVKRVIFTGGGEPLMNPSTIWGLKYCERIRLNSGLFTNGYYLDEKRVDEILDASPSFVRVSLNAGSEETHRLFHGLKEPCFQRILENVMYLAKEKQRRKSKTEVSIGVIISPLNFDEVFNIAQIIRDIYDTEPIGGIDNLNYRPAINYAGHRKQVNEVTKEGIGYLRRKNPKLVKSYTKYLYSSAQFPQEIFGVSRDLAIQARNLLKERVAVNFPDDKFSALSRTLPFKRCLAFPWVTKVGPDGSIYFCVEHGLDERYCIGNLVEQDFPEILSSSRRRKIIEKVNGYGNLEDICGPGCMLYNLNMVLSGVESLDDSGKKKIIDESENYRIAVLNSIHKEKLSEDYLCSI